MSFGSVNVDTMSKKLNISGTINKAARVSQIIARSMRSYAFGALEFAGLFLALAGILCFRLKLAGQKSTDSRY
jgi:hypothetical protein